MDVFVSIAGGRRMAKRNYKQKGKRDREQKENGREFKKFVTEEELKRRKDLRCTSRQSRMKLIIRNAFEGYVKLSEMAHPGKIYYKVSHHRVVEMWCIYGWRAVKEI